MRRLPLLSVLALVAALLTVTAPIAGAHAETPAARTPVTKLTKLAKLVGAHDVAVAIPRRWGFVQDVACSAPTRPYYRFDEHASTGYSCPTTTGDEHRRPVSHLVIDDDLRHPTRAPRPHGPRCVGKHARRACTQSWRRHGVQLTATEVGRGARARLQRLGESVSRLPAGWTAVPPWVYLAHATRHHLSPQRETYGEYAASLDDAGLRSVMGAYDELERATEPVEGTVVATGSRVVVGERTDGPHHPVPPDPTAPRGMKLAGARAGAIAVPEGWRQVDEPLCGGTDGLDKAYVLAQPHPAVVPCPAPPPGSTTAVGNHVVLTRVGGAAHTDDDGVVTCDHATCRAHYDAGRIRFDVVTHGRAARHRAERIGATVQHLPQGWAAVPLWPTTSDGDLVDGRTYQQLALDAGFGVASTIDVENDSVVAPVQGTVLQTGSTVQLGKP